MSSDFEHLVPETMLDIVEQAIGERLTGVATPLPSYINRVYEVETVGEERLIAKFYRPGRWSIEALQDEHDFVLECHEDEIPVIAPKTFPGGSTLHESDGLYFTVFPKRWGRQLEINTDEDWTRVGRLLGRIHVVGSRQSAEHRTDLHPGRSTAGHVAHLVDNGFVTPKQMDDFQRVTSSILELITDLFDDVEYIRLHGDCHCGNLLDRPGEGIMVIDFDDMMVGPPVQDMWLLLPDQARESRREMDLLLRGYEEFREFDDFTFKLVEPLRAMRIIYFLAWCSHQLDDFKFRTTYPEWGTEVFWDREISDLYAQLDVIRDHL